MTSSARHSQDIAERTTLLSDTDTEAAPDDYGELRKTRSSPRHRLKQYGSYAALIVLGALLGSLITSGVSRISRHRDDSDKHGPMVPPIYKLPPPTGLPRNQAYLIEAKHGAVASEDKTCSELGVSILRDKNGTAADAAVTTTLCIGLLNAFASGIGGGGFMVVRVPDDAPPPGDREREAGIWAIDFRETSPAKSDKWMYGVEKAGRMAAQVGGLAVGVPGELRGLEAAHNLYGRLSWEEVVMPVAELARGWTVSRELARRLRIFGQFMLEAPAWKDIYTRDGALLIEGDFVQRLAYGRTLEKIAREGASAFYKGEIAESTVKTLGRGGGVMELDDLKLYKALRYPAIHQTYNGRTIYTTNAPSSGGILLGLLNILEPLKLSETGCLATPVNVHRFIEAMKHAFGARSEITDPKIRD